MPSQYREAQAVAVVECPACAARPGHPCFKLNRRTGYGTTQLKHPHAERTAELNELVRDQGGNGW